MIKKRRCSPWWTDSSGTHRGRRNHLCRRNCSRCSLSHVAWDTRCDRSRDALTHLDRHRALDSLQTGIIALHSSLETTPGLSASAAASWDILKFAAPSRTHLFRSGQADGWTGRTHTGLYVIESDHTSSTSINSSIHPENSFIPTPGGISSSASATGRSSRPLTRVADVQTSATGDMTARISMPIRGVSLDT